MEHSRHLVIGYGNPGRGDDGLGPAVVERIREGVSDDVLLEVDYQLVIEHAELVARADSVWFVDATVDRADAPFCCRPLRPEPGLDFTSHALAPGRVLALADDLYGATPRAWMVTVPGEAFDAFEGALSDSGRRHLEQAAEFLLERLANQES